MSLFLSLGRIRYNLIHVRLKDLIQFLSATIQKIFEIYACILPDFLTVISEPLIFKDIYNLILFFLFKSITLTYLTILTLTIRALPLNSY